LDEEGPNYLPNMLAMHLPGQYRFIFQGALTSLYKAEVLKEKEFYQKYLQRLKVEDNQQKVLDDFFEIARKALHSNLSIAYKKKETLVSSCISTFFIQPLQDVLKTIKPYTSPFQQKFSEYNKLLANPKGGESLYEAHTTPFKDWVSSELEKLNRDYILHEDAGGAADILNRQTFFEEEFIIAYLLLFSSESIELNYTMNREWFYALYNVLENAHVLYEKRKLLWKEKTVVREPIVAPDDLSVFPKESSENQELPLETRLIAVTEKLAIKSVESVAPVEETSIASSSGRVSTCSDSTGAFSLEEPVLIFSKKKGELQKKEAADLQLSEAILKGKHKDTLVELFYGKSLDKIHIPEKTLQAMVTAIGGTVTDGSGSRKRIFYQEKLGFVPNELVVTHYHTTNTRHASPAVLAHYRDFFHRIKLTPSVLWPNEYSAQDYTFNRTTRRHLQTFSRH